MCDCPVCEAKKELLGDSGEGHVGSAALNHGQFGRSSDEMAPQRVRFSEGGTVSGNGEG